MPPFKLAQMMAAAEDKESAQYQRLTWDALRKSINGLVNKARRAQLRAAAPMSLRVPRSAGRSSRACA